MAVYRSNRPTNLGQFPRFSSRGIIILFANPLYHLLHAARADLLRRLGASVEAAKSYLRALALVNNDTERRFLKRRLREVQPPSVAPQ